jgi:hypothetical protein
VYGALGAVALPLLGYVALWVFEEVDGITGDVRAVTHRLFRRYGHARLVAQREAIRDEILAVAREMGDRNRSD